MNNRPKYLTKSRFQLALQCPTKLYYTGKDEYENTNNADEFLQALAEGGYQVGELAKYYHPGGHDVKTLNKDEALEITNGLLELENIIIYEAAIQHDDYFIRVDVLVKTDSQVDLIEVKAKSFSSPDELYTKKGYLSKDWQPYLYDVAFQTWVITNAYPDWDVKPSLMLCDKNKVASVDGLNQLFRIVKDDFGRKDVVVTKDIDDKVLGGRILSKIDVSDHVYRIMTGQDIDPLKKTAEEQKDFDQRAAEYARIYHEDTQPAPVVGRHCKKCEFRSSTGSGLKSGFAECWQLAFDGFEQDKPHIFDIWNLYYTKIDKMLARGIYYMEDAWANGDIADQLNDRQQLQVVKTLGTDKSEQILSDLYVELDSWTFPLHFIDFETSAVAIPFNSGHSPYEQVAFQFSCHTLHKDSRIEHFEWLNCNPGTFPNFDLVTALRSILDSDNGTILRYSHYENTVLRQIQDQMIAEDQERWGDLIAWIDSITEWKDPYNRNQKICGERNMEDLLLLVKKYYYHPRMKGSNSIKDVLPSVMTASSYIRDKYSQPLEFGSNLKGQILWQWDENAAEPTNPYKLLPNQFEELGIPKNAHFLDSEDIQEGGAAMTAYAKMQFAEMSQQERAAIIAALLQYCELDTLAMLMIYEHWTQP